jgi:mgtE-like transporter
MYRKEYDNLEGPLKGDDNVYESVKRFLMRFVNYIQGNSMSLKQSFVAIFLSVLTDILAGVILGNAEEMLVLLPGMVVLVPAAIGMRGNIFGSLGSRLSSALHLGTIDKFTLKSKSIRNNIHASMTLTIVLSIVLGFMAKGILTIVGMKSISIMELVLISFIGGAISGLVLLCITLGISFYSYKRGWDPDNVTSPIITALGDFFTIPALLLSAYFVMHSVDYHVLMFAGFIIIAAYMFLHSLLKRRDDTELKEGALKSIIIQSFPILLFSLALDALSGVLIEFNMSKITMVPIILMLIPAFLEEGGNIGNIFSSRMGTKLHLGSLDAKFDLKKVKFEIVNSYLLSIAIFFTVGSLTFIAGMFFGVGGMSFAQIMFVSMSVGLILTTIVIFLSFFISIISFKYHLDPDNTTIPLISSTADVLGVAILLIVVSMMGII